MQTITKRAVFAEIHQTVREGGQVHEFALTYVKADGTIGHKARCRKTTKRSPGASGYRGNVNTNHVLLLEDADSDQPFNLAIDRITHYNGLRINHLS
ncbi:hypothetical protein FAES_3751 [Fibrella aestuarina BUZ 2]|uniref:Uncharacterized protein n=1 Tax=Fibrella aestuarina BUZ 2 TaxID=1166018 RepID=I0KCA5_9BACT|nr:hypothetical protein [Fibrella aestuarina]CCH01758.1 hypothetical protein FAES_3751 [Fibrella aestuarina BUZ 2]